MRRDYLLALTDGGGTVPPELGVARRLLERGHRVTVLAEDSTAAEVEAVGAVFVPWKAAPNRPDRSREHTRHRDWEVANPIRLARSMADHMIAGPAPGYARDVAAAMQRRRPDLVLTSFVAFGAMVAAEAADVPFDVLLPNIYTLPAEGSPPLGMGLKPAAGPLGRARDRVLNAASTRLLDRYVLPRLNRLRREHSLRDLACSWDQVRRARRQLVMTSAEFDFPATLPRNVRYVGPILDDPSWASEATWSGPPGEEPLALVAMSSTFQDQVGCLQRIVDALATLPVRGLVTTGPALDPDALQAPPNVTVTAAAPHSEVMREATLVITHGGHGTLMKSLAAGLPSVVLHHGRDQADNAVRVTVRGAGVAVPRDAGPKPIARAVQRVLDDPGYAAAAAKLGEAVREDAASGRLIDELERLPDNPPRDLPPGEAAP